MNYLYQTVLNRDFNRKPVFSGAEYATSFKRQKLEEEKPEIFPVKKTKSVVVLKAVNHSNSSSSEIKEGSIVNVNNKASGQSQVSANLKSIKIAVTEKKPTIKDVSTSNHQKEAD